MVGKNLIKVIKKNIFMIVAGFIDFETSSMILFKDEVNKNAAKHEILLIDFDGFRIRLSANFFPVPYSLILIFFRERNNFTCFKVPKFNPVQFLPDLS